MEAPLSTQFREFEVFKPGPWSQGPVMLQQLAISRASRWRISIRVAAISATLWLKPAKLAFATAEAFYGDPAFVDVPMERRAVSSYNDRRARSHRRQAVRRTKFQGKLDDPAWRRHLEANCQAESRARARRRRANGGWGWAEADSHRRRRRTRADTVHIDVDRTATANMGRRNTERRLAAELHLCNPGAWLSTRDTGRTMFWLERGLPSSLAPGKRPRTNLVGFDRLPATANRTWPGARRGGDQQGTQWSPATLLAPCVFAARPSTGDGAARLAQ